MYVHWREWINYKNGEGPSFGFEFACTVMCVSFSRHAKKHNLPLALWQVRLMSLFSFSAVRSIKLLGTPYFSCHKRKIQHFRLPIAWMKCILSFSTGLPSNTTTTTSFISAWLGQHGRFFTCSCHMYLAKIGNTKQGHLFDVDTR